MVMAAGNDVADDDRNEAAVNLPLVSGSVSQNP
jgi:hypothetical protein